MSFREFSPAEDLRGHVDAIWMSTPGPDGESIVFPDGCLEILVVPQGTFGFAGSSNDHAGRSPRTQLLGLTTRPHQTRFFGCEQVVGIRLSPAGGLRLFGDSLRHLLNRSEDAAAVRSGLAGQLFDAANDLIVHGRTDAVIRVLRAAVKAGSANPQDERVAMLIHASSGRTPVASLAEHAGRSTRQLDRSFERCFGIGPKLLSRIARFRRAFELGVPGRRGEWASIAARVGYADQAHLAREFLEFAGRTPEQMRVAWQSQDV